MTLAAINALCELPPPVECLAFLHARAMYQLRADGRSFVPRLVAAHGAPTAQAEELVGRVVPRALQDVGVVLWMAALADVDDAILSDLWLDGASGRIDGVDEFLQSRGVDVTPTVHATMGHAVRAAAEGYWASQLATLPFEPSVRDAVLHASRWDAISRMILAHADSARQFHLIEVHPALRSALEVRCAALMVEWAQGRPWSPEFEATLQRPLDERIPDSIIRSADGAVWLDRLDQDVAEPADDADDTPWEGESGLGVGEVFITGDAEIQRLLAEYAPHWEQLSLDGRADAFEAVANTDEEIPAWLVTMLREYAAATRRSHVTLEGLRRFPAPRPPDRLVW